MDGELSDLLLHHVRLLDQILVAQDEDRPVGLLFLEPIRGAALALPAILGDVERRRSTVSGWLLVSVSKGWRTQ